MRSLAYTDVAGGRSAWSLLFASTIFLNAMLLFLVQPMFGKMALPHLGGSAAAWTVCMLFFQVALLAGYMYAHLLSRRRPGVQIGVHLSLLIVASFGLPISIPPSWAPSNPAHPTLGLIQMLVVRLGVPFVVLAAGSPLIQHWFGRRSSGGANPYWLYAAGNAGSVIGLLAYPLLLEPWFRLGVQSRMWTAGFAALACMLLPCGLLSRLNAGAAELTSAPHARAPRLRERDQLRWVVLAAVPSSLLLGVTTHITTELVPLPLLWVLPLALYLLTFVIAFGEWRRFPTRSVVAAVPYTVLAVVVLLALRAEVPGPIGYGIHLVAFFACALGCHAALAASKPDPARLTEFYVWMSVGGAVGGFFNVIIAPHVFRTVMEYPLALVIVVALQPSAVAVRWRKDVALPGALFGGLALAALALSAWSGDHPSRFATSIVLGAGALIAFSFRSRPLRFALAIASLLGAAAFIDSGRVTTRFRDRSFYNVYRVVDDSATGRRELYSGTTLHGAEALTDSGRVPLAYYHRDGPLGSVFETRGSPARPWRVAVIGLGAGAAAAYALPGDAWTFYEIDPLVAHIAQDPRLFRYLQASRAPVRIVLGDARLSLARSTERGLDLLVVDAFSSDAIPAHLVTREALELYRSRIARDGIIAWHISNKYLDLRPVLEGLAAQAGMTAMIREDLRVSQEAQNENGRLPSIWVVMTVPSSADPFRGDPRWKPLKVSGTPIVWSDDFSNILSILR